VSYWFKNWLDPWVRSPGFPGSPVRPATAGKGAPQPAPGMVALVGAFDQAWVTYLEQFAAWQGPHAAGLEVHDRQTDGQICRVKMRIVQSLHAPQGETGNRSGCRPPSAGRGPKCGNVVRLKMVWLPRWDGHLLCMAAA
jgi:hypothetical protein